MKASNRSVTSGLLRWYLASGDIIVGCSVINAGLMIWLSMNLSVSLSKSLIVVNGAGHSTSCFAHSSTRNLLHSLESNGLGISTPARSSIVSTIGNRFHGGVKSMSYSFVGFFGSGWYLTLYEPHIWRTIP